MLHKHTERQKKNGREKKIVARINGTAHRISEMINLPLSAFLPCKNNYLRLNCLVSNPIVHKIEFCRFRFNDDLANAMNAAYAQCIHIAQHCVNENNGRTTKSKSVSCSVFKMHGVRHSQFVNYYPRRERD